MIPIIIFNVFLIVLLFLIIIFSLLIYSQSAYKFQKKGKKISKREKKEKISLESSYSKETEWDVKNAKTMSSQCQYQADVGYVCPLNMKHSRYEITPYQKCPESVQNDVLSHLRQEWGKEYTNDYIERNWATGDIMYVLMKEKEFVGCIAVDRKNFTPSISQLYVVPKYRKKGYSKRLMEFAIHYVKSMEFHEVKLWCKSDLVEFYEKQGWIFERKANNDTYVMKQNIE